MTARTQLFSGTLFLFLFLGGCPTPKMVFSKKGSLFSRVTALSAMTARRFRPKLGPPMCLRQKWLGKPHVSGQNCWFLFGRRPWRAEVETQGGNPGSFCPRLNKKNCFCGPKLRCLFWSRKMTRQLKRIEDGAGFKIDSCPQSGSRRCA